MSTTPAPRLLSAGADAVLVELADADQRRRLHRVLLEEPPAGLVELVPAARTVLLSAAGPEQLQGIVDHVNALVRAGLPATTQTASEPTTIAVRYDGEDLAQVAEVVGVSVREVVARHTGQLWTVEFAGFMPGFGYLSGEHGGLTVPRLSSPRTRIPAGSVALADEFTGIYPQASPGGWQLIGSTDAPLWDPERTPPALLAPGARIRFVEEGMR
ncbi:MULTISPECIES: 5-oxoprolinase subunit B family protein [unclassified Luteococcus]|uniref:5-oxoprolinase subunit B family protein n=1 Tax=unclassified Luteococcus TaxID=2639923 RepID=UPI00313D346A